MDNWRLKQLKNLLKDDPKDEFIHFAIAQEYGKLEDFSASIKAYEELRRLNPDYIGLYYHLAAAQIENEDSVAALATYEDGISRAKRLGELHALSELQNAKMNLEIEL